MTPDFPARPKAATKEYGENHETPSAAEGRNQTNQKENDRGFRGYARMCN